MKRSGSCPFLGDREHVPSGPPGEDLEFWDLETSAGTIQLKPGQPIKIDRTWTTLRKIRRCAVGFAYGMLEYPDGGMLWHELARQVPELTAWQKAKIEEIERKIPRKYWVLGDMSRKVGDHTSEMTVGRVQSGQVVFMATLRPLFTAGTVVAKDDGSMSIGDDVIALMDGRIAHDSNER